jgi:recombination endonuclease VII
MAKVLRPRTTSSLMAYGLSVSDYTKLLTSQGGVCILCSKGGKLKNLSVDHDHRIKRLYGVIVVNGLLCQRCNRALGAWEWSDEALASAIKYMQKILRNRKKFYEEEQ